MVEVIVKAKRGFCTCLCSGSDYVTVTHWHDRWANKIIADDEARFPDNAVSILDGSASDDEDDDDDIRPPGSFLFDSTPPPEAGTAAGETSLSNAQANGGSDDGGVAAMGVAT